MFDNILEGDDGIGPLGHSGAGRDSHRLAWLERARRWSAGRDPVHDGELSGSIGRAQGKTVHRRAVEWREINGRGRVFDQNAAERRFDVDGLCGQGLYPLQHEPERLLDRNQTSGRRQGS